MQELEQKNEVQYTAIQKILISCVLAFLLKSQAMWSLYKVHPKISEIQSNMGVSELRNVCDFLFYWKWPK